MSYKPKYSEELLNKLRDYVERYKSRYLSIRRENLAASVFTENTGHDRYVFFNNLLFDGQLPNSVKVKVLKGDKKTLGGWINEDNVIEINKYKGMSDYSFDTVLVHEMCHVWQDRIWMGKNLTDHSNAFQYAKRRTQNRSNNYYNGGARIAIWRKDSVWNSSVKEINKLLLGTGLSVNNLAAFEFNYRGQKLKFNGEKFLIPDTFDGGMFARRLNQDKLILSKVKKIYKKLESGKEIK